jgi:tetratricopeptide (TPR) repeat protein
MNVEIAAFVTLLNDESAIGFHAARALLAVPAAGRDALLNAHPEWLRTGTFDELLETAREELDQNVNRADELTAFALRHIPRIGAIDGGELLLDLVAGTAEKDRASVLFRQGTDLAGAMRHIEAAIRIFQCRDSLRLDRSSARLVEAQILHARGETPLALEILAECRAVFAQQGDARRFIKTVAQEGICHFDRGHLPDAHRAFTEALAEAERIGDARETARLRNSLANWALEAGDWVAARDYFVQALEELTALGMTSEVQRALWGIAELDARQGDVDGAVHLLRQVYQEFLDRGMHADAALVYLDIGMKLDAAVPEHGLAQGTCVHFARTMAVDTAPPSAQEAARYLGERSTDAPSAAALRAEMGRVYDFFERFKRDPETGFDTSAA